MPANEELIDISARETDMLQRIRDLKEADRDTFERGMLLELLYRANATRRATVFIAVLVGLCFAAGVIAAIVFAVEVNNLPATSY